MSPDSNEKSLGFIEKIESTEGGPVEFSLLSDSGNATIDHWALRDPAYAGTGNDGIPHPAVFVIDRGGIVRWSRIESDYKQRPALDEIQAALDAVK